MERADFGGTASLVALTLLVVGVVMLLGIRVGFWSAEALVGAELLLLSRCRRAHRRVQCGSCLLTGPPPATVVAAALWAGHLAACSINAFGHRLALLFIGLIGLAGILMLIRYTPAIYGVAAVARRVEARPHAAPAERRPHLQLSESRARSTSPWWPELDEATGLYEVPNGDAADNQLGSPIEPSRGPLPWFPHRPWRAQPHSAIQC